MEELKKFIREVPDFPKKGILFYDITTLIKNPEAFKKVNDLFFEFYKDKNIDIIAGIESRGFIFGSVLADRLNKSFVLIRKPGKLPADKISKSYELEYGINTIELHKDAVSPGKNVLIIDDLLATGGTAKAAAELVETLGGKIIGFAFVIELDFLNGRDALSNYDIKTLIHY